MNEAKPPTIQIGHFVVAVDCPNCDAAATLGIEIVPKLTTEPGKSTLTVRLVTKGAPHRCSDPAQPTLDDIDDEADDVIDAAADDDSGPRRDRGLVRPADVDADGYQLEQASR